MYSCLTKHTFRDPHTDTNTHLNVIYLHTSVHILFFLYLLPLFISHRLFLPVSLSVPFAHTRKHICTFIVNGYFMIALRCFHFASAPHRGVVAGLCVCVCSFCACMCFLIVQALNSVLPHFTLAAAQPQLIFRPALRPYEQRPSLVSLSRALSTCIRTYHFLSCRFHLLNFIAIASLFA